MQEKLLKTVMAAMEIKHIYMKQMFMGIRSMEMF